MIHKLFSFIYWALHKLFIHVLFVSNAHLVGIIMLIPKICNLKQVLSSLAVVDVVLSLKDNLDDSSIFFSFLVDGIYLLWYMDVVIFLISEPSYYFPWVDFWLKFKVVKIIYTFKNVKIYLILLLWSLIFKNLFIWCDLYGTTSLNPYSIMCIIICTCKSLGANRLPPQHIGENYQKTILKSHQILLIIEITMQLMGSIYPL